MNAPTQNLITTLEHIGFNTEEMQSRLTQLHQEVETQTPATVDQLKQWALVLANLGEAAFDLAADVDLEIDARCASRSLADRFSGERHDADQT